MPTRQYIVSAPVTGITGTDNYEGVVSYNVNSPSGPVTQVVCTFTASGSGTDSCNGPALTPAGTVAWGNTFSINRVPATGPHVNVATGAFLQAKP